MCNLIQIAEIWETYRMTLVGGFRGREQQKGCEPKETKKWCDVITLPLIFIQIALKRFCTYWFPNSEAVKRKPVLSTHMAVETGTVSKYFKRISVTWNQPNIDVTNNKSIPQCHVSAKSKRSKITSQYGKNKSGSQGTANCITDVFTTFWRYLWHLNEHTHVIYYLTVPPQHGIYYQTNLW